MKFSISTLVAVALAATLTATTDVSASSSSASSLYERDHLPNGVRLPARSRHPISEQRRRELVDEYFASHPEEHRRALDEAQRRPRGMSKRCSSSKKQHAAKMGAANSGNSNNSNGTAAANTKASSSSTVAAKVKSDASNGSGDNSGGNAVGAVQGLISRFSFSGQCSDTGASDTYPNGNVDFLNCGMESGGWNPPDVKLEQLSHISSDEAAQSSVFSACKSYQWAFDSAAQQTGVPSVMLMAIALQESSCNPNAWGGNGEQGMMQLTPDKCGGINCQDAGQNILKGAQYLKQNLDNQGGNVLLALGQYNGWSKGMTTGSVYNMRQYGNCAQQNMDYLSMVLNGYLQGKDGTSSTYKKYNNLASC